MSLSNKELPYYFSPGGTWADAQLVPLTLREIAYSQLSHTIQNHKEKIDQNYLALINPSPLICATCTLTSSYSWLSQLSTTVLLSYLAFPRFENDATQLSLTWIILHRSVYCESEENSIFISKCFSTSKHLPIVPTGNSYNYLYEFLENMGILMFLSIL